MATDRQSGGFHIFLSYRREGTSAHAGRLHDYLVGGVGDEPGFDRDQIFMDIDTIAPGDDFHDVIEGAVGRCDVLLAVIGRNWVTATNPDGRRRLDDPDDWVRLEIEAALERRVPIVPVLVERASMPKKEELPDSMKEFARRHAVELSDTRWSFDVGRLLASLKQREESALGMSESKSPQRSPYDPDEDQLRTSYATFVGGHAAGEIIDGQVRSIYSKGASVLLTTHVIGVLPGLRVGDDLLVKFGRPSSDAPDETHKGTAVKRGQGVRVKIEDIVRDESIPAGWRIDLSLVPYWVPRP